MLQLHHWRAGTQSETGSSGPGAEPCVCGWFFLMDYMMGALLGDGIPPAHLWPSPSSPKESQWFSSCWWWFNAEQWNRGGRLFWSNHPIRAIYSSRLHIHIDGYASLSINALQQSKMFLLQDRRRHKINVQTWIGIVAVYACSSAHTHTRGCNAHSSHEWVVMVERRRESHHVKAPVRKTVAALSGYLMVNLDVFKWCVNII